MIKTIKLKNMIQKNTIDFLKDIKENNSKAWFDENRKSYEAAKLSFLTSVEEITQEIAGFDAEIGHLKAKECIFRINRDVRFSKDKRPYKNNMSAYFNKSGKKGTGAGYYFHVEPGQSFAAVGVWMPEAENLSKIRQEIDYNFDEWKKLLGSNAFKSQFEQGLDRSNTLVRPPKGYGEDNPALEYLKLKSFVVMTPISDADLMKKSFAKDICKSFKAAKPLLDFINRSLD